MIRKVLRKIKNILLLARNPIFRLRGSRLGKQSIVSKRVSLRNCIIGDYCYIGEDCSFNHVVTGNYCSFAPNVHIGGMQHAFWEPSTSPRLTDSGIADQTTKIGNDVWIGVQCCIRGGISIGDGAVVGANSFVNKDVPPFAIVAGSPAKIIRYRFEPELQRKIIESGYWNYPPRKAKQILKDLVL